MTKLVIDEMSFEEKLQAMEELWESLSREESRMSSPAWHEQVLKETEQRYLAGLETAVNLDTAKKLCRRSE